PVADRAPQARPRPAAPAGTPRRVHFADESGTGGEIAGAGPDGGLLEAAFDDRYVNDLVAFVNLDLAKVAPHVGPVGHDEVRAALAVVSPRGTDITRVRDAVAHYVSGAYASERAEAVPDPGDDEGLPGWPGYARMPGG